MTTALSSISKLFYTPKANTTAKDASAAAAFPCCAGPAISDMSKGSDMTSQCHEHSASLCGITTYITFGATLASIKTALVNQEHIEFYSNEIKSFTKKLEQSGRKSEAALFHPILNYLNTYKSDVTFLRNVPGIMSAVASALIGIGMFTAWPVGFTGLTIGVVDGALHLFKSVELIQRYEVSLKELKKLVRESNDPQNSAIQFLTIEQNLSYGRAAGATLTVIGISCLAAASLSLHGIILPSAAMAALYVGIGALAPAIFLSIKYNAYQDMGLREKEKHFMQGQEFDYLNLLNKITRASFENKMSQNYKLNAQEQNSFAEFTNHFKIIFGEFLALATFNVPETFMGHLNRSIKEQIANSYFDSYSYEKRNLAIIVLSKNHNHISSVNSENKRNQKNDKESFKNLLINSTIGGHVFQLMANQALNTNNTLCEPYKTFYKNTSSENQAKIIELLTSLRDTAPCCNPYAEVKDYDLLFDIKNDQLTPDLELQEKFEKLLVGRFDQYMLFSLNNMSQKDGRIYSRMLASFFDKPKKEEKLKNNSLQGEELAVEIPLIQVQ